MSSWQKRSNRKTLFQTTQTVAPTDMHANAKTAHHTNKSSYLVARWSSRRCRGRAQSRTRDASRRERPCSCARARTDRRRECARLRRASRRSDADAHAEIPPPRDRDAARAQRPLQPFGTAPAWTAAESTTRSLDAAKLVRRLPQTKKQRTKTIEERKKLRGD